MDLEKKLKLLPTKPGVYLMKNAAGEIIYVGKAVSLRNRVRSYFQSSRNHSPKVRAMVENIADFEYIVTDSEVEALILEFNLIQQHSPWYNVRLKDDKRYPYLKVTLNETFPRVIIARQRKDDGARYFGPYTSAKAVRDTMKFLRRVFPIRTCNKDIQPGSQERPCLNYHIGRCLGPCAGKVTPEEYREVIDQVILFLEGKQENLVQDLEKRMEQAARELRFEAAAKLRDQVKAIHQVMERQKIVTDLKVDQDVLGLSTVADLACVQVFFVRGGKLIGREPFFLHIAPDDTPGEILGGFIQQYYSRAADLPKELLLPAEVPDANIYEEWLSALKGSRVYLRVPQRGEKRRLVEMVEENADLVMKEHRARAEGRRRERERAMTELQEALGLPTLPRRIEGFDISNIQGTEAVGSMVVFIDGEAAPNEYRRFKIRSKDTPDDFAMMREVLTRRFVRGLKEQEDIAKLKEQGEDWQEEEAKFAQFPDLLLIDGGKGQLSSVREVLRELNLEHIPTMSLAERLEEIFIEGRSQPILLPRNSPALYLIQRIRDEAHRFALTYHRHLRAGRATKSLLDQIPGVGPQRKKALIRQFGSVQGIRQASLEEIKAVPGISAKLAETIVEYLR
ncbi:MAG: excinuclease ABC subunit UvrC [Firmicutes bacterium]|nr:excinuclease ABC subunit UvrC [Bacillota bacterium]